MRISSFNNIVSSSVSQINEKVVQALSEKHKTIVMVASAMFAALTLIAAFIARPYLKARWLGQAADKLRHEGKLDDAAKKFEEALTYRPKHVFNLIHYGNTLREQKNYEKSLEQYEAVLKIDPKNTEAIKNEGKLLVLQEKLDDAIAKFRTAEKVKLEGVETIYGPMDAAVVRHIGAVLYEQKNYAAAEGELEKAVLYDGKQAKSFKLYAEILVAQDKKDKAAEKYAKFLELKPDDHAVWSTYADLLDVLGKVEDAKTAREKGKAAEEKAKKAAEEADKAKAAEAEKAKKAEETETEKKAETK